ALFWLAGCWDIDGLVGRSPSEDPPDMAMANPGERFVFVSSWRFKGDIKPTTNALPSECSSLFGLSLGDCNCTAMGQSVAKGATFRAFLSSTDIDAPTHVGNGPWTLRCATGDQVAFPSGRVSKPLVPIRCDEAGRIGNDQRVWTGTTTAGTLADSCIDNGRSWTAGPGSLDTVVGTYGDKGAGVDVWSSKGSEDCK